MRPSPKEGYTPTQAKVELGELSTAAECEQALRLLAKAVANGRDPKGCLQAASNIVVRILWSTYQRKRLEIAGFNMNQEEGQTIILHTNDYKGRYVEEEAKNKQLSEEVEALKAQIETMGGSRPRPPRPDLN
jgi:hypothetical protein